MRQGNRADDQLRPIRMIPGYIRQVPGSVLVEQGETRVVCTATYEDRVPHFLKNSGKGWITAEYSMLPGSCGNQRIARERMRINNRHGEIQRFIGRALRTVIALDTLKEKTINLDADVIQADGSTRCASLNGCVLALVLALRHLVYEQIIPEFPSVRLLAAVSLGVKNNRVLVDLDYEEDSQADMDLNLVSTQDDAIVEVQAFTEKTPAPADRFSEMVRLGIDKNREIIQVLKKTLHELGFSMV